MHVADLTLRQLLVIVPGDTHAAVGNRGALGDQHHGVPIGRCDELNGVADIHAVTVEGDRPQRRSHFREADRERGFRESVDGIHCVARQLCRRQARQEFIAEVDGDRLGAVEDHPHGRQIEPVDRPVAQHLQIVFVTEVG